MSTLNEFKDSGDYRFTNVGKFVGSNPEVFTFSSGKKSISLPGTFPKMERGHVEVVPYLSKGKHELYFGINGAIGGGVLVAPLHCAPGRDDCVCGFWSDGRVVWFDHFIKDGRGEEKKFCTGVWKKGDAIKLVIDIPNGQVLCQSPYGEVTVDCKSALAKVPLAVRFGLLEAGASVLVISNRMYHKSRGEAAGSLERLSDSTAEMIRRKDREIEQLKAKCRDSGRLLKSKDREIERLKATIVEDDDDHLEFMGKMFQMGAELRTFVEAPDFKFVKWVDKTPAEMLAMGLGPTAANPVIIDTDDTFKTRIQYGAKWNHALIPEISKATGVCELRFTHNSCTEIGVGLCADIDDVPRTGYYFDFVRGAAHGPGHQFCDKKNWFGEEEPVGFEDVIVVTADLSKGTLRLNVPKTGSQYTIYIFRPVPSEMCFFFSIGGSISTVSILPKDIPTF